MPSNQSGKPGRSWRDQARKPEAPARSNEAQRGWRRETESKPAAPGRWKKRSRFGILLGCILGLVGALILIVYLLWPPRSVALILAGAGYQSNLALPHNALGRKDLDNLVSLANNQSKSFIWGSGGLNLTGSVKLLHTDEWNWDAALDSVEEKSIIIYFSAIGGADMNGPYLLPDNVLPGSDAAKSSDKRLSVIDIIRRLAEFPDKDILLILDATRAESAQPLGMLNNDFVRELKKLEDRISAVTGLVVLCSSDENQKSWASEELGCSVFGHFIRDGLRGRADLDANGHLHAGELYQFVRSRVLDWVSDNRDELQMPILLGGPDAEERATELALGIVEEQGSAGQDGDVSGNGSSSISLPAPDYSPILQAWKGFAELDAISPAPYVYAPHLWREYVGSILRYEQLIMARDDVAASALHNRVRYQHAELLRQGQLQLPSVQHSLAMPQAFGLRNPNVAEQLGEKFGRLWAASSTQRESEWAAIQEWATANEWSREVLRLRMCDLLLRRAAESASRELAHATEVLKVLEGVGAVRPVELHYLVMLNKFLPEKSPPAALLQKAMLGRIEAERAALAVDGAAHPFSENVFQWINKKIEEADESRRRGQDLIFSDNLEAWAEADMLLGRAETLYRAARDDGATVRNALAASAKSFAYLPYFSKWAARLRGEDADAVLSKIENLWTETHLLADNLTRPDDSILPRLSSATLTILNGLSELEQAYDQQAEQSSADLQKDWHRLNNLTFVPRISGGQPNFRVQILQKRRQIADDLLLRGADRGEPEEEVSEAQIARNDEEARRRARNRGRIALAQLGRTGLTGNDPSSGEPVYARVSQLVQSTGTERTWHVPIRQAGDLIGAATGQLPAQIVDRVGIAARSDLNRARDELSHAVRLARQMGSATSMQLQENPARQQRQVLMHDFLVWASRRTIRDHWYADNLDDTPFYVSTARRFLDDAAILAGGDRDDLDIEQKKSRLAIVDDLRRTLQSPVGVALNGPDRREITSESTIRLEYNLQFPVGLPSGFPVVWSKPSGGLNPRDVGESSRVIVREFAESPKSGAGDFLAACLGFNFDNMVRPDKDQTELRQETHILNGVYRGQELRAVTHLQFQPLADTIVFSQPSPDRAALAVRAEQSLHDEFAPNRGALAIVLDCSGSMGPPSGRRFTTSTKYAQVTRALGEVLGNLPEGITVSLWMFGQKTEGAGRDEAAKTIRQVRSPQPWNRSQLDAIVRQVSFPAVEPNHKSPIVQTMMRARRDLRNATGFKTLLVLTDGQDSEFENDSSLNPRGRKSITDFLREQFDDSGIVVNVVGFRLQGSDNVKAREQFEVVESFKLPGQFLTVDQARELSATLTKATAQRLQYRLEFQNGTPVMAPGGAEKGLDVSVVGRTNPHWFDKLKPAYYQATVQTDQQLRQKINLEKGDLLMVDLYREGYQRGLFSDSFPWKQDRWKEAHGWRLAGMQNQIKSDRSLQLMVTLENMRDRQPDEGTLRQVRPVETWLEVKPVNAVPPYGLRWGQIQGYPAPAWGIDAKNWPTRGQTGLPAEVSLEAWWSEVPVQTPTALRKSAAPQTSAEYRNPFDIIDRQILLDDGSPATIQSVQIEEREIETSIGQRRRASCLVVRVLHPEGKPIWINLLPRSTFLGVEHHFYARANAYTGIFWEVSRAVAEERIERIEIFSLDAFKRSSTTRHIDNLMLRQPDPADERPAREVDLQSGD